MKGLAPHSHPHVSSNMASINIFPMFLWVELFGILAEASKPLFTVRDIKTSIQCTLKIKITNLANIYIKPYKNTTKHVNYKTHLKSTKHTVPCCSSDKPNIQKCTEWPPAFSRFNRVIFSTCLLESSY